MPAWKRLATLSALLFVSLLASPAAAGGPNATEGPPDELATAWRAIGGPTVSVAPVRAALRSLAEGAAREGIAPEAFAAAARDAVVVALATPNTVAALATPNTAAALATSGDPPVDRLARAMEAEARAAAQVASRQPLSPAMVVGPLELTPALARSLVGPRAGRDRAVVLHGLRAVADTQGVTMTDDALVELIPVLVAAADRSLSAEELLAPLRQALVRPGVQQ